MSAKDLMDFVKRNPPPSGLFTSNPDVQAAEAKRLRKQQKRLRDEAASNKLVPAKPVQKLP